MSHSVVVEEARTVEDLKHVQAFAASFGHVISGQHPVRLFTVDGIPTGYMEVIRYPLLNCGWKHGIPKQVITGVRHVKAWSEVQFGGTCALVDPTSDLAPHMEKLGFRNTHSILYTS